MVDNVFPITQSDQQTYLATLLGEINTLATDAANVVTIESDTEPTQAEWTAAYIAAGNSLPIPTSMQLVWTRNGDVRGLFSTVNDYWCRVSGPVSPWDISPDVDSTNYIVRLPNDIFSDGPVPGKDWEKQFFDYDIQGNGGYSITIGECPVATKNNTLYPTYALVSLLHTPVEWNEDYTKYAYVDVATNQLRIIDRDGSNDTLVITPADPVHAIIGYYNQQIVYMTDADSDVLDFDGTIWIIDDDGSDNTQLSDASHFPAHAVWGKITGKVYYLSSQAMGGALSYIWVVNTDGIGLTQLYSGLRYTTLAGLNPDETRMIVTLYRTDTIANGEYSPVPRIIDVDFDLDTEEDAFPTLSKEYKEIAEDVSGVLPTRLVSGDFHDKSFFYLGGNCLIATPDGSKYVVRTGCKITDFSSVPAAGCVFTNELDGYTSTGKIYAVQVTDNFPALLPLRTYDLVNDSSLIASGYIEIDLTEFNIPDEYEHLMIIADVRSTSTLFNDMLLYFNDDTTVANYRTLQSRVYRASSSEIYYNATGEAGVALLLTTTNSANGTTGSQIIIPEFNNSNINKQAFSFNSYVYSSGTTNFYYGGMFATGTWLSTDAITNIKIAPTSTGSVPIGTVGFLHLYALRSKGRFYKDGSVQS